jgi:hypothetical protein
MRCELSGFEWTWSTLHGVVFAILWAGQFTAEAASGTNDIVSP